LFHDLQFNFGCKDTVFFVPEKIIPLHFIPAALHFIPEA